MGKVKGRYIESSEGQGGKKGFGKGRKGGRVSGSIGTD